LTIKGLKNITKDKNQRRQNTIGSLSDSLSKLMQSEFIENHQSRMVYENRNPLILRSGLSVWLLFLKTFLCENAADINQQLLTYGDLT